MADPRLSGGPTATSARVAGRVAEGLHVHAFHTKGYLRKILLPAARAGRTRSCRCDPIAATSPVFDAVAHGERRATELRKDFRGQIVFYAATRGYRAVLEHKDLSEPLKLLARRHRWPQMRELIPDEGSMAYV